MKQPRNFCRTWATARSLPSMARWEPERTTFVKAICEELGVEDVITSPTFALVNEYTAGDGSPVYHFDFYRIKKLEEVYDMGYEDYFYSGASAS